MFNLKPFISHSGIELDWKIECDDLSDSDLETLAVVVSKNIAYGSVFGIPTGGERFADALQKYCTTGPRLLVDDVLTTGYSMLNYRKPGDIGLVIFARGPLPLWVRAIFKLCDLKAPFISAWRP